VSGLKKALHEKLFLGDAGLAAYIFRQPGPRSPCRPNICLGISATNRMPTWLVGDALQVLAISRCVPLAPP